MTTATDVLAHVDRWAGLLAPPDDQAPGDLAWWRVATTVATTANQEGPA